MFFFVQQKYLSKVKFKKKKLLFFIVKTWRVRNGEEYSKKN